MRRSERLRAEAPRAPSPVWRVLWPHLEGYVYILPAAIILALFWLGPAVYTVWLSLHKANLILPQEPFVGLANYARLLGDPRFWTALFNTGIYVVGVVPATVGLGLLLAVLLQRVRRGMTLYRALLFLPVITAGAAASVLFKWLYAPGDEGLLNALLGIVGIAPHNWLLEPVLALPSVMGMGVWKHVGYDVILFYAGLQGISGSYYEAAAIDGADRRRQLRYITLPLVAPTTFLVVILEVIHAFQVFAQVFILTQGGPADRTLVLVYYLYTTAFASFDLGYGSTIACVLFFLILACTLLQRGLIERRIHYDA